jgi:hypothetical protein
VGGVLAITTALEAITSERDQKECNGDADEDVDTDTPAGLLIEIGTLRALGYLTSTGIAHALRLSDRDLYSLARKGHGGRNDHGLRGAQKEARESWVRISLAENKLPVAEMFGIVLRIACDRLKPIPDAATIHSMPALRFLLEGNEWNSIADECIEIEPAQVPKKPQAAVLCGILALTSLADVAA